MNRRYYLALALFLLLCPIAVLGYYDHRLQSDIDASRALEVEVLASVNRGRSGMREKIKGMSESQRHAFFRSMAQERKQQLEDRMTDYFAMDNRERVAFLDKRINDDEKRRKQRARNDERDGQTRGRPARTTNEARAQRSPEERAARRDEGKRRMLDNTTPEFRAQMSQYREELNARRKQRGLAPMSGRKRHGWKA